MTNFIIAADSSCDLPLEYALEKDIKLLSGRYFMRGREYIENENALSYSDFYSEIKEDNACSYSFINVTALKELFLKAFNEGKDVLFISSSSGNSKTYSCAQTAAQMLADDFPGRQIYILDSKSISAGEAFLIDLAVKMRDKGNSVCEIYSELSKTAENIKSIVACGGIDYFVANKRLSKLSKMFFKGYAPVFCFDENGKFVPFAKAKNASHAKSFLISELKKSLDKGKEEIYISHGNCLELAKDLENAILEKFPKANIKILCAGAALGSIVGADSLGIYFV